MSVVTSTFTTTMAGSVDAIRNHVFGRIRDVDTHEMFPASLWAKEYGDFVKPVADFFSKVQSRNVPNSFALPLDADDTPMSPEHLHDYWGQGCTAPGAFDMQRRLRFMDLAGVKDSLVFGSMIALLGQQFAAGGGIAGAASLEKAMPFDTREMGRRMVKAHNDWCIRTAATSPRLRPVGAVLVETLAEALAESERMIRHGVRAIMLPTGQTIEGKAPSHPDNDALWQLYAKNRVSLLLHIGGELAFLREQAGWVNAPHFYTNNSVPTEIPIDPLSMATCSLAAQNYLTNLILGAVFERVPDLCCGVMELGAHWVGSTGQNMDLWAGQFAKRMSKLLSMKPSEYLRKNVRVSPFTFEPVDLYFDQCPYLQDMLCFSTDYPHFEGGRSPIGDMAARVQRFGPDVVEKFFVTNAELVMPS